MDFLHLPQMLLIAGNGRETGKTTLACRVIRKFSRQHRLIAVKISPHLHITSPGRDVLYDTPDLYIEEEHDRFSGKDSARMLNAGAERSFYVTGGDQALAYAVQKILGMTANDNMLVCESGSLRKFVEPGMFMVVYRKGAEGVKERLREVLHFQHTPVIFDGHDYNFDMNEIVIQDTSWIKNHIE